MFEKCWDVLIVDDEPDVLSVSKLALKTMKVFGLPLRVHTAQSKGEGLELAKTEFSSPNGKASTLAVALIDVVMESNTAGLELCKYFREDLNNHLTQIVVRTGQPGIAPEKEVIDKYNISGYVSKAEATEDKLYTIIKTGINQFYWSSVFCWLSNALSELLDAFGSREAIKAAIKNSMLEFHADRKGELIKSYDMKIALKIDGQVIAINLDADVSSFNKESERFKNKQSISLSGQGDQLHVDGNSVLYSIAAKPNCGALECLAIGGHYVPDYLIFSGYLWLKTIGAYWKMAK